MDTIFTKAIFMVVVAAIASSVFAYDIELRWTANNPADNVKEYKVYKCMSSLKGICQPRVGKDPRFTNMTSITFVNMTTVKTKLRGLVGVQNIYVTASNPNAESGSSNVVTEVGIFQIRDIRLVKE